MRAARPRLSDLERLALEKAAGGGAVSVASLVGELSGDPGCSPEKAAQCLIGLRNRGVLVISEGRPYLSFADYAVSPLSLWFWGAISTTLLSVLLLFATSGVALELRYALGAVLVLFLPGFSVIEALYPRRGLDGLTKFALSVALSLAVVPLVGLALNYLPVGIRLMPLTASLACLVSVSLSLALRRRYADYRAAKT